MTWHISAFYRFTPIPNPRELVETMTEIASSLALKGTLLVASEGVNGTVAGSTRPAVDRFLKALAQNANIDGFTRNDSTSEVVPFHRLKVKLKKEIIAFRQPCADPLQGVGQHVEPRDWNDLITRDDVVVLDTRNSYEIEAGTFQNALHPQIDTFGEFANYTDSHLEQLKQKKVAMFCTGGIRCEKASAYLLAKGVTTVYQLKGGILNYLRETPEEDSLFQGTCYVFDERTTVG